MLEGNKSRVSGVGVKVAFPGLRQEAGLCTVQVMADHLRENIELDDGNNIPPVMHFAIAE